jgi:hypothetical protein
MNEVTEIDNHIRFVTWTSLHRHVERPLAEEGLTIRWHVAQIIHNHEYLDDTLVGVEQRL